jgi:hypothetical protein
MKTVAIICGQHGSVISSNVGLAREKTITHAVLTHVLPEPVGALMIPVRLFCKSGIAMR